MSHQSEAILENNVIKQLIGLGYESVKIQDGEALVSNLKAQLEVFNKASYSDEEFDCECETYFAEEFKDGLRAVSLKPCFF